MTFDQFQIGILYNVTDKIDRGDQKEYLALTDNVNSAMCIQEALVSKGFRVIMIPVNDSLEVLYAEMEKYSPKDTLILNNCDDFAGSNLGAVQVISLIENMGFAHTGANSDAISLCINKNECKNRLNLNGLITPDSLVAFSPDFLCNMKFPLIVKPVLEDGSIGIEFESVVTDEAGLEKRVNHILEKYHQAALIEEFINGREFSVSMWGNDDLEVLPISEIDYSRLNDPLKRILTFDAKWKTDSEIYHNTPLVCPADISEDIRYKVSETAKRAFRSVNLRDIGRVDIRFYEDLPFVIDINELPALAPEAGFSVATRAAGYSFPDMLEKIIEYALQREEWI